VENSLRVFGRLPNEVRRPSATRRPIGHFSRVDTAGYLEGMVGAAVSNFRTAWTGSVSNAFSSEHSITMPLDNRVC